MSCPDPYRPSDPLPDEILSDAELKVRDLMQGDTDVRGLTNTLAASGGGSASNDLALDLVLNQIVEQACLATGATGAAIALLRNGEMVCRATTGRNAPDLGVRLDNAGFSAECLRIGTLQRCDDTETDPRVDSSACRLLGVRSILVVPLWYWGEFMGIFEIFSPRPNAFGERDEQTLQALAYRIVRQAKQATGMITGFPDTNVELPPPPAPKPAPEPPPPPLQMRIVEVEGRANRAPQQPYELTPAKKPQQNPDMWTMLLAGAAAAIACAIVGLMIWRVGWADDEPKKVAAAAPKVESAQPANSDAAPHDEILELGGLGPADKPQSHFQSTTPPPPPKDVVVSASSQNNTSQYVGGLAIYDHGKLVYGAPITDPNAPPPAKKEPARLASTTEKLPAKSPAPTPVASNRGPQISPDLAEGLLTNRVEPDYPDAARRAHVQGTVTVDTVVSSDGKVLDASAISGTPQLSEAAVAAVRQWQYKPYTVNGKKSGFRTQVPVTFMLPQ
jgi:TonB family protein